MGCPNGTMIMVDTLSGSDAVAFDPVRRRIFSSNGRDETITACQPTTPDAGFVPRGAVRPATGGLCRRLAAGAPRRLCRAPAGVRRRPRARIEWQAWHEEYQADEQHRWADEHIRRATYTTVTAQRTIVYADSADEAEETKLDLRF